MKKGIKLAVGTILCVLLLWNLVGYAVRSFLDPKLLSSKADYQLYIHLSSTVHDFPSANPLSFSLGFVSNVWDVEQGLRAAADEAKITSVLIHLDNVSLTISQALRMGEAIKYFRSKGKKVVSYSASFDPSNGGIPAYLLASYCDEIQIQRLGSVRLERLKPIDVMGEEAVELPTWDILAKVQADIDAIIHKNRHQKPVLNDGNYIDSQALKAGLVDAIVPKLIQSEYTIVIQDYIRLLEKSHRHMTKVVAVIPVIDDVEEHVLNAICNRPDVQAVVVYVQAKSRFSAEKIGNKPVVMYSVDQKGLMIKQGNSLKDAIDRVCKLASLDRHTVRVELIHPGSWISHMLKDLTGFGKSVVSMFKRSINYVKEMAYRTTQ